ncbi:glycoside hydrolase family 16 protein [Yunchengibacter salinarum]|uniref:glycoside hydrolase family 16 protein n=1 Tax=Yunchengibacter salinarum TaxID=3133399 RepID=UPI0035B5E7B8
MKHDGGVWGMAGISRLWRGLAARWCALGLMLVAVGALSVLAGPQPASEAPERRHAEKLRLILWDDFTGERLDPAVWRAETGDGCPDLCGFGNDEAQTYADTADTLRLDGGHLVLEAHDGPVIRSAKVTTAGRLSVRYGRIAVRAKLPTGRGTWPAIWMLPEKNTYGPWPRSGEIDIMEHVGFDPGRVHGTIHTAAYNHKRGTEKGASVLVPDAARAFHTYSVDWTPQAIVWKVDGTPYHRFEKQPGDGPDQWPFDRRFHLILNLAIGGQWGGREGVDRTALPARMVIDWVKVWQRTD